MRHLDGQPHDVEEDAMTATATITITAHEFAELLRVVLRAQGAA